MRTIKFRLTLKGKVVGFLHTRPNPDGILETVWNSDGTGGWIHSEPPRHDRRDQLTGLADRDGRDIYEGDVLSVIPKGDKEFYGEEARFFVEVSDSSDSYWGYEFNWSHISGYECVTHIVRHGEEDSWSLENVRVIGNIHQHPELLTKSND